MIEACPEGSALSWPVLYRDPKPLWSQGRVVLLGDACHPMKPHMGQGAAMATEDAAMLVRCFGECADGDLGAAFDLYEAQRFERTTRVKLESDKHEWMRHGSVCDWLYGYDVFSVPMLRRLGTAVMARPDLFGADARLGYLLDALERQRAGGKLPAAAILAMLLDAFSEIWPGGQRLDGKNLGDVWPHRAARTDDGDSDDGLVPFHKLSQWLCYSLIEPLEDAGLAVSGIEVLTGLPEYRNGGLFIDMGVIVPRRGEILAERHAVSSEIVVEWRALTVVLLDRLAARVGTLLGRDNFPLPLLLEGGSWAAGRRIAAQKRPGGAPPLLVESDGTVF